jgi:hypothetical protein
MRLVLVLLLVLELKLFVSELVLVQSMTPGLVTFDLVPAQRNR